MRGAPGSAEITLRGLVTARWVLLALLAAAAVLMASRPAAVAPFLSFVPDSTTITVFVAVLGVWAALNLGTARFVLPRGGIQRSASGIHLLIDVVAFTLLLMVTGGATNPFTTLYFVPITLATQVSPRWTWSMAGVSLAGFAALFLLGPVPQGPPGHEHHFAGHLQGMWLAFGASGLLITYFVHSIALSLAVQRQELLRLREEQIQDRHLASLGSLAAGAAHELGTPLGTISVLVGELDHMSDAERTDALGSIRAEVKRCKGIVQRMATPDARISALGVDIDPWPVADLAAEADNVRGISIDVDVDPTAKEQRTDQPYESLAQIVRELLTNAAEACKKREGSNGIRLGLRVADDRVRIEVSDDGIGMDDELATAAFDPFLSTKPEGEGMGLGLYLSRAQLRQLGGSIDIDSTPGSGTTVAIDIPRLQPEAAS